MVGRGRPHEHVYYFHDGVFERQYTVLHRRHQWLRILGNNEFVVDFLPPLDWNHICVKMAARSKT